MGPFASIRSRRANDPFRCEVGLASQIRTDCHGVPVAPADLQHVTRRSSGELSTRSAHRVKDRRAVHIREGDIPISLPGREVRRGVAVNTVMRRIAAVVLWRLQIR